MYRWLASALVLLLFVTAHTLTGQSPTARGKGLGRQHPDGPGRKAVRADPPPELGALNGEEAVAALAGGLGDLVRAKGKNPDHYSSLLASDPSAWITDEGDLLFVDVIEHEASEEENPETEPSDSTGPPPTPIRLLANGLPIHHSKPGAPWTIYLDFDGETVFSRSWRISGRVARPLTIDPDSLTFNADEQAIISRTWGRVAEDWAPFDVNVTTERPAAISNTVLWSIIARNPLDLGFPPFVGGISQFNCFYMPFGLDTPTFTFWQPIGATDHSTLADVISQENGHMFGLLHDGIRFPTGPFAEYYTGHGTGPTSWGPVMGAPNSRNVTQWSRGEYSGAYQVDFGCGNSAQQDDIAIIGGKLGFRSDDVGNTIATASSLAVPAVGYLTSTTDIDVYALPRVSDVRIEVTPFRAGELTDGGNLDVAADIVNASGVVVASIDDPNETTATLSAVLPTGAHYLRVRSSFDPANYPIYDSVGQYTVTGTFVNVVRFTGFTEPVALGSTAFDPGRTLPVKFGLTDAVAAARVQLWSDVSPLTAQVLAESSCRAQTGFRQHCNLKLPSDLAPGWSYWIAAQYQDLDGHWVTAQIAPGVSASNPVWLSAR